MLECLVQQDTARALHQFGGPKCNIGIKPLLSFSGSQFEDADPSNKFVIAKNILVDFFRGEEAGELDIEALQMIITFTASELESQTVEKQEFVYMRVWRVVTKRSGQRLPRVELEEMGPRIDFRLGRVRQPDSALLKTALKKGRVAEVRRKHLSNLHLLAGINILLLIGSAEEESRNRPDWGQDRPNTSWTAGTTRFTNT